MNPDRPWDTPELFPNWRIKGLLIEGSSVMDTGASGQQGYTGKVYLKEGHLCVKWQNGYGTSITWGSGLNLRTPEGLQRALDWLAETGGPVPFNAPPLTLKGACILGTLVIEHADSYDPQWRRRYTSEWWREQK